MDDDHISIDPNEPVFLRYLVASFFNAWEQSAHNFDSARLVLQSVPDWQKRYEEALANPDRIQYTTERFAEVQKVVEALLEGTATRSQLDTLLARLGRKPN